MNNGLPILFTFSSPGGGGKSTICRELIARDRTLQSSISTTTRKPRGEEADGRDYFFVSEDEFEKRVQAGQFIESAWFGGCRYGTEVRNIEQAQSIGCDLLLAIDVQGAAALKLRYPEQTVTICVFPPSRAVLEERLRGRGTESSERIAERMKIAQDETRALIQPGFSDYLLINDGLEQAVAGAAAIVAAERQRFSRFSPDCVRSLLIG